MFSLLNSTIRTYILIGILLYAILFIYWEDSLNLYNALNVYVFLSFALLLNMSAKGSEEDYTMQNLGGTIFFYSLIMVILYVLLSDYHTGNTFLFSESDARKYEHFSFAFLEKPIKEWTSYMLSKGWTFDDWGGPIGLTLMLHIIPSKLFANFCYIILNSISGIFLFNIGKSIMATKYAYMAALSYSISSYTLFFLGSFLKEEMFVFFVIWSYYLFYEYYKTQRVGYLVKSVIVSLFILFFRPPVIAFVWMAYFMMIMLKTKSSVLRFFGIAFVLLTCVLAIGFFQHAADTYANGGDITESYEYVNTSTFQKITLYVGALIGPFPQLLQTDELLTYKPFYGAGLLFKLLLFMAFWVGLYYSIRNKNIEALPLYICTLLEMLGLSVALDGLELRKAMPHIPLFILCAFWYMSKCDEKTKSESQNTQSSIWVKRQFAICATITFVATLVWNIWRV